MEGMRCIHEDLDFWEWYLNFCRHVLFCGEYVVVKCPILYLFPVKLCKFRKILYYEQHDTLASLLETDHFAAVMQFLAYSDTSAYAQSTLVHLSPLVRSTGYLDR